MNEMQKYIKLAWLNTWRNWRRTLIATVTIVLSLILLIFMEAFMDGTDEAIYGNVVRLYGGNVLIHAPGYRERSTRLPLLPLNDPETVLAMVDRGRQWPHGRSPLGERSRSVLWNLEVLEL